MARCLLVPGLLVVRVCPALVTDARGIVSRRERRRWESRCLVVCQELEDTVECIY